MKRFIQLSLVLIATFLISCTTEELPTPSSQIEDEESGVLAELAKSGEDDMD